MLSFMTKARTLENLKLIIKNVEILPMFIINILLWKRGKNGVLEELSKINWTNEPLIVRSSAGVEDSLNESLAGHFDSVLNVQGVNQIIEAVNKVIDSFNSVNEKDEVFIQPMLTDVVFSGVAFSKDPNTGANYIVINYDDKTGTTDSVTSGSSNETKTYYYHKMCDYKETEHLDNIVKMVFQLEEIFQHDSIDVEFAITKDGRIYLLQVRPLCVRNPSVDKDIQYNTLKNLHKKIKMLNKRHPYLYGEHTVFGVMPDWNPAEIIGIRPNPLAMSLYKELVTDNIWAYQRDNYGYKNLRSFPLMYDFAGIPFIDVRVSFNSFLPKDLEDGLCEKLVNYYINRLIENPQNHDKVEFEIIYSCYTLDLQERLERLRKFNFSEEECEKISLSLRNLTNKIIDIDNGLWKKDIEKISELEKRRKVILESDLDKISKIYWLLEDCKRYGTLPFAGLARAGFIAVQMLKSLVNINILSNEEYQSFLGELDTVSSKMRTDLINLNPEQFVEKYGHLRPGTYDILSPRYDEEPEKYFNWNIGLSEVACSKTAFQLSLQQLNDIKGVLKKHKLVHDVISLFNFIKTSIEAREYSKFVFTKSLSDAMLLFKELAIENGFSVEDSSYADIEIIKKIYASSCNIKDELQRSINIGKERYEIKKSIVLPPVIIKEEDVFVFHQQECEPNYITLKNIEGRVVFLDNKLNELEGSILMIPSADPGYDWIFSHKIRGFITMYGGINSHMAIRAGELGVPAVIGAGELLYQKWSKSSFLNIDCANRKVSILK